MFEPRGRSAISLRLLKSRRWHCRWLFVYCFLLAACASVPAPEQRRNSAEQLASEKNWQPLLIHAAPFSLMAYEPTPSPKAGPLTVYIEGDGFAWRDSSTPSLDPTPLQPVALQLALRQPKGKAVYLGRPCQYVDAHRSGCLQRYWTGARFAEEVVIATGAALDVLKQRHQAERLVLVGFSGGGAVAALVAARRQDVDQLVTVAGNLDHRAWTAFHRVDPLTDSLNAADVAERLRGLPQLHFIGERDTVIPPVLARSWSADFLGAHSENLRVVEGQGHGCCWSEQWPALYPGH